jgi:hypothetical protein
VFRGWSRQPARIRDGGTVGRHRGHDAPHDRGAARLANPGATRKRSGARVSRRADRARDQPLHAQDGGRESSPQHRCAGAGPVPSEEVQGSDDGKRRMGSDPGGRRRAWPGRRAATTAAWPRPRRAIYRLERTFFPNASDSARSGLGPTAVAVLRSTAVAVLGSIAVAVLRRAGWLRRAARRRTHGCSQQEQGIVVSPLQRIRNALQRVAVPVQQRQQPPRHAGGARRARIPRTSRWSWSAGRRPGHRTWTGPYRRTRTSRIRPGRVPAGHGGQARRRRLIRSLSFETAVLTARTSRIRPHVAG